jgi:hypothetical protein
MTSGGMVDHALQRIEAYCKESGVVIEVFKIPSADKVPFIRPPIEDQNP